MLLVLVLVVAAVLIFYLKLKYFTLRGPLPGLPPHFFFENVIQSGILFNDLSMHEVHSLFKSRLGDTFQFWFGPSRVIIVSGIGDVQHIFTHRNIHDQGDIVVEQLEVLFPDALMCLKGQCDSF